ncbi:bacteriohemerythrin [uncultured Pseudodesulfovibrio sp.]|uniref:bacteriohemerythrin n=1 Tax=uncultured Pseudodesulfovibrio sp. TaxID=2035858 RepID=UPI0029C78028|nr:bacteriohemerythrin [uncultured Pseudodesulfovibrio sp.]
MPHLQWTEDLTVGLPRIDDQHKQLIAIANKLIDAIIDNETDGVLADVFTQLRAYVDSHFKDEESYMEEIGYPELKDHAAEHAILYLRTLTLKQMLEKRNGVTPQDVSLFLTDWISSHMMDSDRKIGNFAKSL